MAGKGIRVAVGAKGLATCLGQRLVVGEPANIRGGVWRQPCKTGACRAALLNIAETLDMEREGPKGKISVLFIESMEVEVTFNKTTTSFYPYPIS